jgi:hypothetical protein
VPNTYVNILKHRATDFSHDTDSTKIQFKEYFHLLRDYLYFNNLKNNYLNVVCSYFGAHFSCHNFSAKKLKVFCKTISNFFDFVLGG